MRFVFWAVVAVVAFVVLRRIGIAALFSKPTSSGDTVFGGGGFGGVTAPDVTPTPTGPTSQTPNADGHPVTTVGGSGLYTIPGTSYLGVAGSKASDVTPGFYKTATSGGSAIAGANIPGLDPTKYTQGITTADLTHLTDFHRNDANVTAQVAAEKNRVAPGQTYKFIGGYDPQGRPILIY